MVPASKHQTTLGLEAEVGVEETIGGEATAGAEECLADEGVGGVVKELIIRGISSCISIVVALHGMTLIHELLNRTLTNTNNLVLTTPTPSNTKVGVNPNQEQNRWVIIIRTNTNRGPTKSQCQCGRCCCFSVEWGQNGWQSHFVPLAPHFVYLFSPPLLCHHSTILPPPPPFSKTKTPSSPIGKASPGGPVVSCKDLTEVFQLFLSSKKNVTFVSFRSLNIIKLKSFANS